MTDTSLALDAETPTYHHLCHECIFVCRDKPSGRAPELRAGAVDVYIHPLRLLPDGMIIVRRWGEGKNLTHTWRVLASQWAPLEFINVYERCRAALVLHRLTGDRHA